MNFGNYFKLEYNGTEGVALILMKMTVLSLLYIYYTSINCFLADQNLDLQALVCYGMIDSAASCTAPGNTHGGDTIFHSIRYMW